MYIERKRPEDEEDLTKQEKFKKKKVFSSVISFYIFTTHRLIKNKIKKHNLAKNIISPLNETLIYIKYTSHVIHHI